MPTQPLNTAAIEARLAAATPGPYRLQHNVAWVFAPDGDREVAIHCTPFDEAWTADAGDYRDVQRANADLIAHAPADLRALLDEVREVRQLADDAVDLAADILGYVPDYFRLKHKHDEALAGLGEVEWERTDDRGHWYRDTNPYTGAIGMALGYSRRAIRRVLNPEARP